MKSISISIFGICLLASVLCNAQSTVTYINFIRQVQYEEGVDPIYGYLNNVQPIGQDESPLAMNPGGALFQLYTIRIIDGQLPGEEILLSQIYLNSYMPSVEDLRIVTLDTTWPTPRTRVDIPFQVVVNMNGLLSDETMPQASSVSLWHKVMATTPETEGQIIDWQNQASLAQFTENPRLIESNEPQTIDYLAPNIVASPNTKARGQERFSISTLQDGNVPPLEIASKTIQIWPLADGLIDGITSGQRIRSSLPQLTLTLNELYPQSTTYIKAYQGGYSPGTPGRVILESQVPLNQEFPHSEVRTIQNYDYAVDKDGEWTFELVTDTPFGRGEYLNHVTFTVDRSLDVKASLNTLE